MITINKKQALEEMSKMWGWIGEQTLKRKEPVTPEDYFKTIEVRGTIKNNCFYALCVSYDLEMLGIKEDACRFCPIKNHGTVTRIFDFGINVVFMETNEYKNEFCFLGNTYLSLWDIYRKKCKGIFKNFYINTTAKLAFDIERTFIETICDWETKEINDLIMENKRSYSIF